VNSAAVEQGSTVGVGVFGGEVACVFLVKSMFLLLLEV
jgi:hypothetical protein